MRARACRGCGAKDLTVILALGDVPLANALISEDSLDLPEARYPLELAWCGNCSLAQLTESVSPDQLFEEYSYFSSYSDTMVKHSKQLVERLVTELDLGRNDLAIEVASNDGYLLQHYVNLGIPVLGIDPARNVVVEAEKRGVNSMCAFFTLDLAQSLRTDGVRAKVLHANNVIAHVPEINQFIQAVAAVLADDGVAVIETPYFLDLVENVEFDTIYHEHIYYYSMRSAQNLFERNGLSIFRVEQIPIHGGSLRLFACPPGSRAVEPSVNVLLGKEEEIHFNELAYFSDFSVRVEKLKGELTSLLDELKQGGASIAAYGASAKGAILLNTFGIGTETLDFVADRSLFKQGMYMPGVRIPIVQPEVLTTAQPDYVLVLAWNFIEEIQSQQSEYLSKGGKFIVPLPQLRLIPTN